MLFFTERIKRLRQSEILEAIQNQGFVVVCRGVPGRFMHGIAEAQLAAGMKTLEITLDSDNSIDHIRYWAKQNRCFVGAGTVLFPWQVTQAVRAGASFIVSPDFDPAVIRRAILHNVPVISGCETSTEIKKAWHKHGSSLIKLHPGVSVSQENPTADYVNKFTPLSHIPALVSGGINFKNAEAFLQAGAAAVAFAAVDCSPNWKPEEMFTTVTRELGRLSLQARMTLKQAS